MSEPVMRKVKIMLRYDIVVETDFPTNTALEERLENVLPHSLAELLNDETQSPAVGYVEVEDA